MAQSTKTKGAFHFVTNYQCFVMPYTFLWFPLSLPRRIVFPPGENNWLKLTLIDNAVKGCHYMFYNNECSPLVNDNDDNIDWQFQRHDDDSAVGICVHSTLSNKQHTKRSKDYYNISILTFKACFKGNSWGNSINKTIVITRSILRCSIVKSPIQLLEIRCEPN